MRDALRVALRSLPWLTSVTLVVFAVGIAVYPQVVEMRPAERVEAPVDVLYRDHDCQDHPDAQHTLMLIDSPTMGAVLLDAAFRDDGGESVPDEWRRQHDLLTDVAADFYGWCR